MSQRRRIPKQRQKKTQQTRITRVQIGVVVGMAIIMVLAFIVLNQAGNDSTPAETASADVAPVQQTSTEGVRLDQIPHGLTDDGAPVLGSPDAPVTIVEYSDYQCPHCGAFAKETFPKVVENFIATGQVRYIHKDAAILGEESQWAAMAALCAADQDKFWNYHDLLFQHQGGRNQGTFSRDNLKQFAVDLGLDTAAFNECLDSNKYSDKVVAETSEGKARGVEGTPSFFIDDELIPGNVPFEQMKATIEKHLGGSS